MGIESFAQPYAFERIFALSGSGTEHPQDKSLQIIALQAELARLGDEADAAQRQARADGFAAGMAQARDDAAAALLMAEAALTDGIARLEARFQEAETRMANVAAEVAMVAAAHIAAHAVIADPCLAVDAAIARVLSQIGFRESLHVHVHPSLAGPLQAVIDARGAAEQRPLAITLHAEPALPPGDAHVLWDQGGLSLDAASRTAAVRAALGLPVA